MATLIEFDHNLPKTRQLKTHINSYQYYLTTLACKDHKCRFYVSVLYAKLYINLSKSAIICYILL